MLSTITRYLDAHLRIAEIADYANALNGLQLDNDGRVTKICAAVDASLATVRKTIVAGGDLLLVHHGLFWNGLQTMTGRRADLFRVAFAGNLAIYSAHLPLDTGVHGNSVLLAHACFPETETVAGWTPSFEYKGTLVGVRATLREPVTRELLAERLAAAVGDPVRTCPGGPEFFREIGVITGSAGSEIRSVAEKGVDTLITGEGPHWSFALAEEVGANIFYGGHYATETFGVKSLAAHLSEKFGLPWEFIDHPSGL